MKQIEGRFEKLVFLSRWFQAPMYAGLILASVLYCGVFLSDLWHMGLETVHGLSSGGKLTPDGHSLSEFVLLGVLGLVDMTMVANLVIMVIVGGYSTFVSRLDLEGQEDRPDWLEKVNAGTLKVKLASSLATVSGIHLLKSFVDIEKHIVADRPLFGQPVFWQVLIHAVFLLSSLVLAWVDTMGHAPPKGKP